MFIIIKRPSPPRENMPPACFLTRGAFESLCSEKEKTPKGVFSKMTEKGARVHGSPFRRDSSLACGLGQGAGKHATGMFSDTRLLRIPIAERKRTPFGVLFRPAE